MISTDQLRRMKSSAVLINTARGAMVDEEALAAALKDGIIAGAGLDVMRTEPAFGDNLGQLRDLPNVVILPHLGSSTHDAAERGCSAAIDIVVEYLSGKGARNRVA
jgi:phosphoglycerate dehydrogenase-like enzyme